MPFIEWSSELETGIAIIDRDHKVLVELLNQLHEVTQPNAPRDEGIVGSILAALVDYTDYHFAREERLQEVSGYPSADRHHDVHVQLRMQAYAFRDQYERDPDTVNQSALLDFLKAWLLDHIVVQDMDFVPYAKDRIEAIRAAEEVEFGFLDHDEKGEARHGIDWARLNVLVVDDSLNARVIVQTILKTLGVRNILTAESAEEALGLVAKNDNIDMLVTDWRMEGMDGLVLAETLRNEGFSGKILMMSGYGEADFGQEIRRHGVDAFLEKPVTARGFLDIASRVLEGEAA